MQKSVLKLVDSRCVQIQRFWLTLRFEWGVFCHYLAIQIRVPIKGKRGGGQKEKFSWILFCLQLNVHSYLHTNCSLLADFESFDNFDHIFGSILWIVHTSIWPNELSQANKEGVGFSFVLNLWLLKINIFDYRHLMSHRGSGYNTSENYSARPWGLSFRISPWELLYHPQWRENRYYLSILNLYT